VDSLGKINKFKKVVDRAKEEKDSSKKKRMALVRKRRALGEVGY
jgi:hypothetical protein